MVMFGGHRVVEKTETQTSAARHPVEHFNSSVANRIQRTDPKIVFPVGESTPATVGQTAGRVVPDIARVRTARKS